MRSIYAYAQPESGTAAKGRERTKPLPHRQVGVYDVLLAQQEDVPHIDVVCGDIHAEQLLLPSVLMLHRSETMSYLIVWAQYMCSGCTHEQRAASGGESCCHRTWSTVVPVMKANAYSPCLGCRMSTHSLKEAVLSLAGFTAAPICVPKQSLQLLQWVHHAIILGEGSTYCHQDTDWRITCFAAE